MGPLELKVCDKGDFKMKQKVKRKLALLVISALFIGLLPTKNQTVSKAEQTDRGSLELDNPRTDSDGTVTWDCVYFGNYWQEDTDGNGTADQEDEKQPIKWRVLSVDGMMRFCSPIIALI